MRTPLPGQPLSDVTLALRQPKPNFRSWRPLNMLPSIATLSCGRKVWYQPVRSVIDVRIIAIGLDVAAAARLEREPVLRMRVAPDDEEVGAERLVELELVEVGRTILVVGRLVGAEA